MYAADAEGSGAGGTMSDEAMARMLQRQFDQEAEMHEAETRLHNVLALNTVQPTVNPPLAAANAEVSDLMLSMFEYRAPAGASGNDEDDSHDDGGSRGRRRGGRRGGRGRGR